MGMDRKIERSRWRSKRLLAWSAVGFALLVLLYHMFTGDTGSRLYIDTEKAVVKTVERGDFQEYISVVGNVLPIRTVYLDAIEGGRVEKKYIEAGTMVNEGDVILELANTNLLLDIMYREAQFFEQRNNLRNTRLSMEQNRLELRRNLVEVDFQIQRTRRLLERNTELMQASLISAQEFEQMTDEYEYLVKQRALMLEAQKQDSIFRQIQIDQLEESLGRMESNLEVIKQKQESLIIKAPVTGYLTSLNAEIGESKKQGERLGQIDILDGFKVGASIDEYYISRIEPGRGGNFELAGNAYRLTINKIYPEVREGKFEVDMEFNGSEPDGVRRGQTLHIRLELGDLEEAILLPRGSSHQKTGGRWVYVVDESGDFAVRRDIRLGRQNPQFFEVLEGLEPGEQVIISSYDGYGETDKLILE